jgi:zinc transporter 1/2/3
MSVFVLFFVELMVMRFARFGHSHDHDVEHSPRYVGSDLQIEPQAYNRQYYRLKLDWLP